jgi:hypothetical protein
VTTSNWEVRPCYLQATGTRTSWDICRPGEPDDPGVCVVASVFEGEDVANLIAAAPKLYDACGDALELLNDEILTPAKINKVGRILERALTKARGESSQ